MGGLSDSLFVSEIFARASVSFLEDFFGRILDHKVRSWISYSPSLSSFPTACVLMKNFPIYCSKI